ncbi:type IV secretory system conjugative DNA transfer family protein [Polaromonas sp.]|uniref:type IV secretory system conjugative DNA transfer family protein n=1 Tax=Polaromonas sp. TaxID=1869339 RepID=UPI00352BCFF7
MLNTVRILLAVAAICAVSAQAQTAPSQVDSILNIGSSSSSGEDKVGYAREQILREAATALGARAGLSDRSKELLAVLDGRAAALDARYNFNPLVIGASVLPPVISESRDVVALEAAAMRVAGAVFRIDEPARFAMPTPTWRDWLYVGLDGSNVSVPSLGSSAPATSSERQMWQRLVKESYQQGRAQAQAVFDANLALLDRVHSGMRRYFDLWQRGMVSAPIIASNTDLVVREDPNTIAVGNTLYRITAPTDFRVHQQWTPLE